MTREWRLGDVARSSLGGVVARTAQGRWVLLDDGHHVNLDHEPRPLVVIDPEDREQVERLLIGYWTERDKKTGMGGCDQLRNHPEYFEDFAAALREFADPAPKPDEPMGLGAVVEDENGIPWVRCQNVDLDPHWYARNKMRDWSEIQAVRVLSEGVVTR